MTLRTAVVVGGGHNGLVCAALLAKDGVKVTLVERRANVGGAAVTEEFHPGFKAPTLAHTVALRPWIVEQLDLASRGLTFIDPEPRAFLPLPGGRGLTLWGDPAKTAEEIRKVSAKDAERWPAYHATLARISAVLARVLDLAPPDIDRPRPADLLPLAGVGLAVRGLGREDGQNLMRWLPMAAADFASEWFKSAPLRAFVCGRAVAGRFAGPRSPSTGANLLLDAAAIGGHAAGSARTASGGPGAVTQALLLAARAHGVAVRTASAAERIVVEGGRVRGVALAGGEIVSADAVVSGLDPKRTALGLLDPALLDPDDLHRLQHYRMRGVLSKVNLALTGLPSFTALASASDAAAALRGRIVLPSDPDDIERAFDHAKYGEMPARPMIDATIPTLVDPSLAPGGAHVMSVTVQYTPWALKGGWNGRGNDVGDLAVRTLEEHAPGLGALVKARQVFTPADLEREFGLTGGDGQHGEHALDQLFVARPMIGWGRYRTPIPGLFLCGAGTHPGGGVTGAPGGNAAREILKDLG